MRTFAREGNKTKHQRFLLPVKSTWLQLSGAQKIHFGLLAQLTLMSSKALFIIIFIETRKIIFKKKSENITFPGCKSLAEPSASSTSSKVTAVMLLLT